MKGNEIRQKFIEFFEKKKHKKLESASLIPDDPTLLLTVAGMVPFKSYFLGQEESPYPRITTYQKCIRTNDLENVGKTARHHTFFEMLGNFSFGDYFKEEAIIWSYEFITQELKLPKEKLWISVFTTDDEAEEIWIEKCDFPKERIVRMGESENWWSAGPVGSCGPCSEIHVDLGVQYGGDENSKLGDEGTDNRFIEIWNLVFTEYNKKEDGTLEALPKKNIDTGAGLERVAAVVQGKSNNFETDLIFPIVEYAGTLTNTKYGKSPEIDFSLKVITDHSRAITFLINDGVLPSSEGRGYILRRILRRGIRHGRVLGNKNLFLYKMVDCVIDNMKIAYPELLKNRDYIKKIVKIEEESFSKTLDQGINLVNSEIKTLKNQGKNELAGEISFKMYDTYGFPFELTQEICENEDIVVNEEEFKIEVEKQKNKARNSRKIVHEKGQDVFIEEFYDKYGVTKFDGYSNTTGEATILSIREREDGNYNIIFDKTVFYAESGGQEADRGEITTFIGNNKVVGKVLDAQKQKEIVTHVVKFEEGIQLEKEHVVLQNVDMKRRGKIIKNHTAAHLLQKALQQVLGSHITQAGSNVSEDKLRFDFNHFQSLTETELEAIEKNINMAIEDAIPVEIKILEIEEAKKIGAMALFGDKYGDIVRVADISGHSIEFCGGIHVENISTIGSFKIISESGIAGGVRRIEAVTGLKAYEEFTKISKIIKNIEKILKTDISTLEEKIEKNQENLKENSKELDKLKSKLASFDVMTIFQEVIEINGVKVLIKNFKEKDSEYLREICDKIKEKLGSCIVVLGSNNGNAIFAVGVTKDLIGKVKAGDLAREAALITDGKGGGRPDFAQAGGKSGEKVIEALNCVKNILKNVL